VPPCAALNPPEFPGPANADGLVYNTYLERYLLTAIWWDYDGRYVCAFAFALSAEPDSLEHSPGACRDRTQFCSVDPDRPQVLERLATSYPTIIDHADTTVNFERAGRTPYLYYVRFNRGTQSDSLYWLDRDLVRVPLTFTRID